MWWALRDAVYLARYMRSLLQASLEVDVAEVSLKLRERVSTHLAFSGVSGLATGYTACSSTIQ
jgi:hypothetical protein